MRHLRAKKNLNRTSAHMKAMSRNMATSLLEYEKISTTLPKAKQLRGVVERMITLGKKGSLADRRRALGYIRLKSVVHKLFSELADRYKDRPGGYTRIYKLGVRTGDNAPMAVIELVERNPNALPKKRVRRLSAEEAGG
ncbi:LSU ribosomal protein L17p [hydrothermal vent metagenome]|uniref:LSU ribosomal protein L17p n=1 Tax=hydrothermal vent metagenome TaxID=652676 RepID=A0A3B1CSC2_9ZZZZ